MLDVIDEMDMNKLPDLTFDEHALLIAKLCEQVEPYFVQFEARVKLYRPTEGDLVQRADYAQYSPRMLKKAIEESLGDAAPM